MSPSLVAARQKSMLYRPNYVIISTDGGHAHQLAVHKLRLDTFAWYDTLFDSIRTL